MTRSLPIVATLVLIGVSWAAGHFFETAYRSRYLPELSSVDSTEPFTLESYANLRLDSRLSLGNRVASFELRSEVYLDEGSMIEWTVHQPDQAQAQFVSFVLSADDAYGSRFALANHAELSISKNSKLLTAPHGKWFDFAIHVDGAVVRAFVDHEEIDDLWAPELTEGYTSVQGIRGSASLRDVKLIPMPNPTNEPRQGLYRTLSALVYLAPFLGSGILSLILCLGSPRRFWTLYTLHAPAMALAFGYLIYLTLLKDATPRSEGMLWSIGCYLGLQTVIIFTCGKKLRMIALLAVMPIIGSIAIGMIILISPRLAPDPTTQSNLITHYSWPGTSMRRDMTWFEHPLVRRWNEYLANRRFRSRAYGMDPEPERVRILALGTSSTWGHGYASGEGVEYPAQLERMLTKGSHQVEVINGAIPGSNGARLYLFLRDQLIRYKPGIITLSLRFNDSAALSQSDERQYYEEISDPSFVKTLGHSMSERFKLRKRQKEYQAHCNDPVLWLGGQETCRIFRDVLSDFHKLCDAHSIRLLLIREPLRETTPLTAAMGEALSTFARDCAIPTMTLEDSVDGRKSLFLDVVHPNSEGHKLIAEAIAQKFLELKWVKD